MQIIPITAVPSQTLNAVLAGQSCKINIYEKSTGVFFDLFVSDVAIETGVICRDRNKLVNRGYLGFIGDLAFCDLQGTSDPFSSGMGTRFVLVYLP